MPNIIKSEDILSVMSICQTIIALITSVILNAIRLVVIIVIAVLLVGGNAAVIGVFIDTLDPYFIHILVYGTLENCRLNKTSKLYGSGVRDMSSYF